MKDIHRSLRTIAWAFSVVLLATPAMLPQQAELRADKADTSTALHFVDPFIGTAMNGAVVPGASVPFGFISVSPDTTRGETSGYDPVSPIIGFSSTHVSGTGGDSKYGNFRVTPTVGLVLPYNLRFERSEEVASPGYYGVALNGGAAKIKVELTATRLVSVHRYTFPARRPANILIDVTSAILVGGGGQKARAAHITILDDRNISGWVEIEGGWGGSGLYKLYFHAVFDRPAKDVGTWKTSAGKYVVLPGKTDTDGGDQHGDVSNRFGAYATFDTVRSNVVMMKLGVSTVGTQKAFENIQIEAPAWDFESLRKQAEVEWSDALSHIQVTGVNEEQTRTFYTALYHSLMMPHDLSGDNGWWKSEEPHYEDFYTLWDTFRTQDPLLTVILPERQRGIIRSLLDTYVHTGWIPDGRIAGGNGNTQAGSNGDVLIADAIVKHLGGFDKNLAYEAIKKDGDVESDLPLKQGRELADYIRLGYMSLTSSRSATRTVEYAYDDYAISVVAGALGKTDDEKRFRARSGNWKNLWDSKLGCIHPRYANGDWLENYRCDYVYPDRTASWWNHPFYEGSGNQYATFVPQDPMGLIEKLGGPAKFVRWLDTLFDTGQYDQGNEPSFLAAFDYIFAGRPDKTDERVRAIMRDDFKATRDGLPGNDDAGAMSAWYVWNAMGLYPDAGQPYYFIGSPIFERSTIKLESGKTFSVIARSVSDRNLYVLSANLNGKSIDRAWITNDELMAGGALVLQMGPKPARWATAVQAPPSPAW